MSGKLRFETTEYEIKANVTRALRFVFVSDLHDCPNDPIIGAIEKIAPDAVLVGGDYIHNHSVYERGFEFLRRSAAICPTFAALGNHEIKSGLDVRKMTRETGAILIDDSDSEFEGIRIGALTSASGAQPGAEPDLRRLRRFADEKGFKLLLCHHPEYYERYIKPLAIDLTLAGHAHGGQWRLFGRGVFAPGQGLFPKYTSGMYDGRLIVGRGLGNPIIVPRIFNKRELIILNLIRRK